MSALASASATAASTAVASDADATAATAAGATAADEITATAANAGDARTVCHGCGERFASRSAVFRHLRLTGCGGAAPERVERFVVVYAYDGRGFHGSQWNGAASERRFPTAEGRLAEAVRVASVARHGAEACDVAVSSRASRTDRGVHAYGNVCFLTSTLRFAAGAPPVVEAVDEAALLAAINAAAVGVAAVRCYAVDAAVDLRRECFRRDYAYFLDYASMYTPRERALAAAADEDREVWVGGLPAGSDGALRRLVAAAAPDADVAFGDEGATVSLADAAAALRLRAALDGATLPGAHVPLMPLPASLAEARRGVHARLRPALRDVSCPACKPKSYHNFTDARVSAGDPRAVRCVDRFATKLSSASYCVVDVAGASFLYRQILSMIGLVVEVAGERRPLADVAAAFKKEAVAVPVADADRLVLRSCAFRRGDARTFGASDAPPDASAAARRRIERAVTDTFR